MLRCCAGICGGAEARRSAAAAAEAAEAAQSAAAAPERRAVAKPVIRLDESEVPSAESAAQLTERFSLQGAPPGSDPPLALVSPDFQRNSSRLLVLVPAAGAPLGTWEPQLPGGVGSATPLLRWAEANRYAVALFSAQALAAAPADVWDRVLRGSPARFAAVLVAEGMFSVLRDSLLPLHPLLCSRFRTVCVRSEGAGLRAGADPLEGTTQELRSHLATALVQLSPAWAGQDLRAAHQELFEILLEREERWSRSEMKKYAGFQDLKENDMPGLRRMPVETRIQRLDRDRANDELSRLLAKHEKAGDSDEEPGVD